MRKLVFAAALAASLAGFAALAGDRQDGWLTLQGRAGTSQLIVDGATWRCQDNVCRTRRVKSAPAGQVCRQLAGRLGVVTGFGYRGETFDAEALAACNAG
ncbi:MAG: CC_3452 family protein [Pseudomonadota bacterium]